MYAASSYWRHFPRLVQLAVLHMEKEPAVGVEEMYAFPTQRVAIEIGSRHPLSRLRLVRWPLTD